MEKQEHHIIDMGTIRSIIRASCYESDSEASTNSHESHEEAFSAESKTELATTSNYATQSLTEAWGMVLFFVALTFIIYFDEFVYYHKRKPLVLLSIALPYAALVMVVMFLTNSIRKRSAIVFYGVAAVFFGLVILYYFLAPHFEVLFKVLWTVTFFGNAIILAALNMRRMFKGVSFTKSLADQDFLTAPPPSLNNPPPPPRVDPVELVVLTESVLHVVPTDVSDQSVPHVVPAVPVAASHPVASAVKGKWSVDKDGFLIPPRR